MVSRRASARSPGPAARPDARPEQRSRGGRLRISQEVLQEYPAFAILEHLDRLKVSRVLRDKPDASCVVVQKGQEVVLEEF